MTIFYRNLILKKFDFNLIEKNINNKWILNINLLICYINTIEE